MLDPNPVPQLTPPSTPTDPTLPLSTQDSALSTQDSAASAPADPALQPPTHNSPLLGPDPVEVSPQHSSPSPHRLAANRANALRSTGPRTPDGKSRSALNALSHGLRARLDPATLVPATEREDFTLLLEDFRHHLDPQSPLEELLVERIALLGYKLRRHAQAEARLFDAPHEEALAKHDHQLEYNRRYRIKAAPPPAPTPQPAGHLLAQLAATAATRLETLRQYETATERAFYKALRQYHTLHTPPTPTQPANTDLHHHFHYHHHAGDPITPHPPTPSSPHLEPRPSLPPSPECAKSTNEPTDPGTLPCQNDVPDQNSATAAFGSEAVVK